MLNRRARLFLAGLVALVLVTALTTRLKTDISVFVVSGDNAEEILLANEMQSGALSRRILLSVTAPEHEVVPPALVAGFVRGLSEIPGVADVWLPEQSRVAMDSIQSLYADYGANLYALDSEVELERLLNDEGLADRAGMLKQALLSPQGKRVKQIALRDPLLLLFNGFRMVSAQLPSQGEADSRYRNLIVETRASGLDVPEQKRIQQAIDRVFAPLGAGHYRLEMTGVPVYALVTQSLIQEDIARVSLLSCAAVTLLFLALFRSFLSLFRVLVVMIAAISAAVLVTNLLFGYVHGLTLAVGTTLIGVCIDYPIHALAHAQTVDRAHRLTIICKIWPSMVLGGATTLIGYLALGFSGYPGFQQIAVYAGSGIVVALLVTRFVFPYSLDRVPGATIEIPGIARWAAFCRKYRRALTSVLVLLLVGAAFQLDRLNWVEDLQKLTPEIDGLKERDRAIRSRMVSVEPGRFILLSADDTESVLQKAEQIYPLLDRLLRTGDLEAYFGLYPWLLSDALQRKNHAALNARLTPEVRESWKRALEKQGLSVEKLGNPDYARFEPLTPERVLSSPVRRLIAHQIVEDRDRSLAMIWIGKHSPEKLKAALEPIEGAQYFSQRDLLNKLALSYRERAQTVLTVGVVLIFFLLWMRYRRIFLALKTLLPSFLSAYLIFAVWSLAQTEVSFLHLVGFILVVAICVDYGIFYQENRAKNLQVTYQAMAASMLTSAVAFGCLSVAQTTSLKILSGVVSLGVVFGFLLCPLIIQVTDDPEWTG